jgi:hypothetical protein
MSTSEKDTAFRKFAFAHLCKMFESYDALSTSYNSVRGQISEIIAQANDPTYQHEEELSRSQIALYIRDLDNELEIWEDNFGFVLTANRWWFYEQEGMIPQDQIPAVIREYREMWNLCDGIALFVIKSRIKLSEGIDLRLWDRDM